MPEIISESLLQFLLKELPLKDGQERRVHTDKRKDVQGKTWADTIKSFQSLSTDRLQQALEKRLLYFSSNPEVKKDEFYCVKSLIEESKKQGLVINVDVKDDNGLTALAHCSARNLQEDIEALLMAGANPFLRDKFGRRPLDYDIHYINFSLIENMVAMAEQKGDYIAVEELKNTMVHYVHRRLFLVGFRSADGEYKRSGVTLEDYKTPLDIKQLNINRQDSLTGNTMLFTVIDEAPHLVKDALMYLSPDLQIKNNKGYTAFDWFLTKKSHHASDLDVLEIFLQKNADFTVKWPLPSHHRFNSLIAERLVGEARDNKFHHYRLVANSFDVNTPCPKTGLYLLTHALINRNLEMFKFLLDHDADPNARNKMGSTTLHMACYQRMGSVEIEIIKLMLKAGANPHIKNNDGETAFDLARDPILKELLNEHSQKETTRIHLSSSAHALLPNKVQSQPESSQQPLESKIDYSCS